MILCDHEEILCVHENISCVHEEIVFVHEEISIAVYFCYDLHQNDLAILFASYKLLRSVIVLHVVNLVCREFFVSRRTIRIQIVCFLLDSNERYADLHSPECCVKTACWFLVAMAFP